MATAGNYFGIEIGGTKLQMVAGGADGRIHERHRLAVDRSRGAEGIREQIAGTLGRMLKGGKPAAVGVGFGGPVDWRTGRICRSHHIEGWSEFDLGGWLMERAQAPVFVDNDANVAALGEAMHGAGAGANPVFYVTLGSGVGGGLVAGGRIYHGAKPGEAEIGHVRLDRAGTIVEERCSGWAVDARIRALKTTEPGSALARMTGTAEGGEAKQLAPALAANDPAARRILREVAEDLAFALAHATQFFHPEAIILGGGLSLVGEPLRAAVAEALPRWIMEVFQPGPAVRLAGLGEDVVPVGALTLAAENLRCGAG
jgi:glucokinase